MSEIIIREIEENDLEKGFLESLDFLRKASDIDKNKAKEILKKNKTKSKSYNPCCHR
jgi:glucosamine-phosphate N-acetyltransferase